MLLRMGKLVIHGMRTMAEISRSPMRFSPTATTNVMPVAALTRTMHSPSQGTPEGLRVVHDQVRPRIPLGVL